jgi:hypothetical protein
VVLVWHDGSRYHLCVGCYRHYRDELLETALIGHARSSYGHGIPLFPQAMIYVVFLGALVIMLASLLSAS